MSTCSRRTKAEARRTVAGQAGTAEPTAAQRLAAWEVQTTQREVQALSTVHEQAGRFAAAHAARAPAVLDDAAKRKAARIAVAEVQQHHAVWSMAQLRFEVHRALPVLKPGTDGEAAVTEVATLAVSGRAGIEVIQVTAPDITDVTSLGVRASDGGSIYRPPNEERYCTLAHLDTEQQILTAAKRTVPQLVRQEQARRAVERTGLNAGQRDAVVVMLTATAATTALVAPAGAGKSHTMAEFARLWTTLTGRRVIGLATATNAARVLASEGLAESYNIAQFLGKVEGSDELRLPVPLHRDDVLVLDEASQLSTTDLAMVLEAVRTAGARLVLAGDTEQLGAVEAGGMFRLLAREVPCAELALARHLATQREQLEAANDRYQTCDAGTSSKREAAGKATAELERRKLAQRTAEQRQPEARRKPQTTVQWWRQLESDLAGVNRAIEREHQAAVAAGKPWPPERRPQPQSEPVREPENSPGSDSEAYGQSGPDDQTARLDELLAQATEAAGRFTQEKADREGRAQYATRLEREAHAGPERAVRAEASYEAEIEL